MERSMGLFGVTSVGVGAIVGGGVLALSGIAFATTGPSAIIAFALNGLIAVLTALSFAEMAVAFPESGGTYTFSKKVLSTPAAFMVGWVVWFASVVASVLYSIGFAVFAANALDKVLTLWPLPPHYFVIHRRFIIFLALVATLTNSLSLIYKNTGGGHWATWGKVAVFSIIILGGVWHLAGHPPASRTTAPFFPAVQRAFFRPWDIRSSPFRDLTSSPPFPVK
jgi:amino acid transporter